MKKLLVLVLVLGMASMASAAFQLSVNGQIADEGITLEPSDWIELDIHIDPGTVFNGGNLAIMLSNNQGILEWNGHGVPEDPDYRPSISFPAATIEYSTFGAWFTEDEKGFAGGYAVVSTLSDSQNVVMSGGDITWNAVNNPDEVINPYGQPACPPLSYSVLMEGLMFHCEEETDVEISLVAVGLGITMLEHDAAGNVIGQPTIIEAGTVLDTIMVHQVPEPMTMSLLALGGLGLLRRRRA
jgi:PEP-CTERM motif-containing protein